MSDIYRLDNLGGMTVGASQSLDNFAEVIDHLFENYPYKDVLKLLGLTVFLTCLSISPVEIMMRVKPESFARMYLMEVILMILIQKQNTVMRCVTD